VFNRHTWITDQAGSPEVLNDIFGVQLFEFFYLSVQLSFLLFQWQTVTFFFFLLCVFVRFCHVHDDMYAKRAQTKNIINSIQKIKN
jgi:uncharacterized membrane protein